MRISTVFLFVLFATSCWASVQRPVTEANVSALESKAQAGERESIRQLFGLLFHSDGAVTEAIQIALGKVITRHPQKFLEELQERGITANSTFLEGLLGNLGEPFVDNFKGQVEELKTRRAALLSVDEVSLQDVRDQCVNELDDEIEMRTRAAKEAEDQAQ